MRRRGSLSARLRAEVQSSSSSAAWGVGDPDGDASLAAYPCDVKPGVFFYKYLQPYAPRTGSGSLRRLRASLPLTVVAERPNGQEAVLWLETDASGCVARLDKAPAWRRKLYSDMLERSQPLVAAAPSQDEVREAVLAVRTTPRWRPKQTRGGSCNPAESSCGVSGSAANAMALATAAAVMASGLTRNTVVLTTETFDHVVNVPSELPVSVQRFVRSRGHYPSVYRVYWDESGSKSYAVNLLNGLRFADAPIGSPNALHTAAASAPASSAIHVSIPPAAVLSEQALGRAAALAEFLCVTTPTDPKVLSKLTKIRGKPVAEPIATARRIVEHAQLHLPGVRFRAMTVEFLRDAAGTWWFLSVVDFRASLFGLEGLENGALDADALAKASAVHLADLQRTRHLCRPRSVPVLAAPATGSAVGTDGLMTRSCFLCGSLCELSAELKREVLELMKGDPSMSRSNEDIREMLSSISDYRMTLKMALETVYLLRQRGVVLSAWEAALQAVRRSPVQGVVEFAVCLLCYRVFKHQQSLQKIAHELHLAFGSTGAVSIASPSRQDACVATNNGKSVVTSVLVAPLTGLLGGVGAAANVMNSLTAGSLGPDLFEVRAAKPTGGLDGLLLQPSTSKRSLAAANSSAMLERITSFQREAFPGPLARHRSHAVDGQHSQYEFAVVDGDSVDPSSTQMRVVFFFHELQDGGPDLMPTDFYLEYQLGQCFNHIYLEGSKCHTPNRWQLCEARVHYTLATVEAFSKYCVDKKLLIKMKRRVASLGSSSERREEGGDDEFFGYSVLSFKPLITAAKWFGNSLQPEARTDYLLELHTTQYGLLTLKLTIGLLVDPVPLRSVRDVVCSRAFLEERAPTGSIYWPSPSLCLCGLAIPRDWIGALMPSEYISVLPMRVRTRSNSSNRGGRRGAGVSISPSSKQSQMRSHSQSDSVATVDSAADGALRPPPASEDGIGASAGGLPASMSSHAALSRACMFAKSLARRIADDATVAAFPTTLMAIILRQTRYRTSCEADRALKAGDEADSCAWGEPATLFFTRTLSIDQLAALTRAPLRSTLVLLGELLLVMRQSRFIPHTIDISALEELVEPFWLQKGGVITADSSDGRWQAMPRTSTHVPERRAVWNRAVRRCDAVRAAASASEVQIDTSPTSLSNETSRPSKRSRRSTTSGASSPGARQLTHDESTISGFRSEYQTLTLCDLFEEMEALDNGYLDIAELRSLRKTHESSASDLEGCAGLPSSLELIGTRERLTPDEVESIAHLIDKQQHRAAVTTLQSMIESGQMVDALEQFDQQGYGNLSFDDFRQLADDALQAGQKTSHTVRKEPTTTGFCIRHGAAEVFAIDTVCVQCTKQLVARPPVSEIQSTEGAVAQPSGVDSTTNSVGNVTADGGDRHERSLSIALGHDSSTQSFSSCSSELRAESTATPDREMPLRHQRAITGLTAPESFERPAASSTELHATLERLQAAEWHVRHRQETMGKASFRKMIAELSTQSTAPRQSTGTPSMTSSNQETAASRRTSAASAICSVETDVTRTNGSVCLAGSSSTLTEETYVLEPPKSLAVKKKQKRKMKRALSGAPSFMAMGAPLLSSLLRAELGTADTLSRAGRSGGSRPKRPELHTTRSTDQLIERVSRTEAKRKQLDRLVLAELDEVKQRLARLLNEG